MRRLQPISATLVRIAGLFAALSIAACGSDGAERPPLDLATTTSVQNSGLLEYLLPGFTGAVVHTHAAGSGRALDMLADGIVDVVISHAPDAETSALAGHQNWAYRKIAFNRFVVVGPANDPADVRSAPDVIDAFRRIAAAPVAWVSRGDGSGTHEREMQLWDMAGVMPHPDRVLVSGRSMAVALRHAQEKQAYTIADEATFWQLEHNLDLKVVFEHDERLLNSYGVIHARDNTVAQRFGDWLATGAGREKIDAYRIEGRQAFTVWPASCPGHWPGAMPCGATR